MAHSLKYVLGGILILGAAGTLFLNFSKPVLDENKPDIAHTESSTVKGETVVRKQKTIKDIEVKSGLHECTDLELSNDPNDDSYVCFISSTDITVDGFLPYLKITRGLEPDYIKSENNLNGDEVMEAKKPYRYNL